MSHEETTAVALPEASPGKRGAALRYGWLALGFLCVGLGFVGAVLPLMPSTVFFVAAAFCFSRSSPRFLNWLLNLPVAGPLIRDFREGRGMPLSAKIVAVSMLSVAVGGSALFAIPVLAGKIGAAVLGLIGIWVIVWRVPTRR
ncbi:hypothetical protein HNR42_002946 [Deinobacterium chartae]|uniref:DUF454 domain-containing protein n=1 Tax=Deinobacterium chartae TaxID=521158 RepID=A0A841I367_9DEIO|nr:YbaN family protein [Deinobacterium chartae]MBB6099496.1 hypothetical protein [Deinobacterium chartae]